MADKKPLHTKFGFKSKSSFYVVATLIGFLIVPLVALFISAGIMMVMKADLIASANHSAWYSVGLLVLGAICAYLIARVVQKIQQKRLDRFVLHFFGGFMPGAIFHEFAEGLIDQDVLNNLTLVFMLLGFAISALWYFISRHNRTN